MKCDLDIRKVGIKCEFDNGRDFVWASGKVFDCLEKWYVLEYENNHQDSLYITRVIKNGIKVSGKLYSGRYYTRLNNLEKREIFYFYIELEESFNDDENHIGGMEYLNYLKDKEDEDEEEDEQSGEFYWLFATVCDALKDNNINFMLHNLTVTVKVDIENGDSKAGSVHILDGFKHKDNTYNVMENNFRIIDDNFEQHVAINCSTNKTEVDLNLKRTYIFSPGFNKQDVIDLLTKKYIIAIFDYTDEYLSTYDRMHITFQEEEVHLFEEDGIILSFNFDLLDYFFNQLGLEN